MPRSASCASAISAARSMSRPSASSVSAAPAFDEAARLPCLATGTPQAATTMATAVETLSVWWPSPPVPQTSIALAGAAIGISRVAHRPRRARRSRRSVSPRSDSATRNAAICLVVARAVEHRAERGVGLVIGRAVRPDRGAGRHGSCRFTLATGSPASVRKLASRAWPCSVAMLSGWNWTPWIGSVAWRKPMTVAVVASLRVDHQVAGQCPRRSASGSASR